MKVKQRPEDFRVEEESRLEPGPDGTFSLYRLEKSGINTTEALRVVRRSWRLAPRDTAFAGLKDRHGKTGQVVSVRRGPPRNFAGKGFRLNYLGRSPRPAGRGTIEANRFRIVLRDLARDEAERVRARALQTPACGYPDYFDDQRFGSLRGTRGAFIGKALLLGDDEEALRLAIASPARADRSRTKRRRRLLRERWGRWDELVRALEPSLERRICGRLAEGASFAAAYAVIDPAIRSLHLAAYQSHLWNACLRRAVGERGPRHEGVAGPYLFYEGEPGTLRDLRIALPSAEAPGDERLAAVLAEEGIGKERLRLRPGARDAVTLPRDLAAAAPQEDDLNGGRWKLELAFTLRPGSYATMLVKRCTYDVTRSR